MSALRYNGARTFLSAIRREFGSSKSSEPFAALRAFVDHSNHFVDKSVEAGHHPEVSDASGLGAQQARKVG
jgi:hypothetical protein